MWLWIFAVFAILVIIGLFYFAPFHTVTPEEESTPTAPSTEWTEAPTGPAVPVDLPKTPMTNVPEKPSQDASPKAE